MIIHWCARRLVRCTTNWCRLILQINDNRVIKLWQKTYRIHKRRYNRTMIRFCGNDTDK